MAKNAIQKLLKGPIDTQPVPDTRPKTQPWTADPPIRTTLPYWEGRNSSLDDPSTWLDPDRITKPGPLPSHDNQFRPIGRDGGRLLSPGGKDPRSMMSGSAALTPPAGATAPLDPMPRRDDRTRYPGQRPRITWGLLKVPGNPSSNDPESWIQNDYGGGGRGMTPGQKRWTGRTTLSSSALEPELDEYGRPYPVSDRIPQAAGTTRANPTAPIARAAPRLVYDALSGYRRSSPRPSFGQESDAQGPWFKPGLGMR